MSEFSSKASNRVALNRSLLAIVISVFFLIVNVKEGLLLQQILTFQLILAIPLFLTSILSYAKVSYKEEVKKWDLFGWVTFMLGYAFLLNIIGILVGNILGILMALLFFLFVWILLLIYSFIDISYNKKVIKERLAKDLLFILVQFFLGVLVVLKIVKF
jgi:O-antigen ligase